MNLQHDDTKLNGTTPLPARGPVPAAKRERVRVESSPGCAYSSLRREDGLYYRSRAPQGEWVTGDIGEAWNHMDANAMSSVIATRFNYDLCPPAASPDEPWPERELPGIGPIQSAPIVNGCAQLPPAAVASDFDRCPSVHIWSDLRCVRTKNHDGLCFSCWEQRGDRTSRAEWQSVGGQFKSHSQYRDHASREILDNPELSITPCAKCGVQIVGSNEDCDCLTECAKKGCTRSDCPNVPESPLPGVTFPPTACKAVPVEVGARVESDKCGAFCVMMGTRFYHPFRDAWEERASVASSFKSDYIAHAVANAINQRSANRGPSGSLEAEERAAVLPVIDRFDANGYPVQSTMTLRKLSAAAEQAIEDKALGRLAKDAMQCKGPVHQPLTASEREQIRQKVESMRPLIEAMGRIGDRTP